ncbi:hypothetical protein T02_16491 [Trichinella nativa]|uniref:Uncharacterized protein n=2 Tax=Trichinella TaxID=6333 RepID=A0A0V1L4N2_9BILA|nr:hypothetical protein T06_4056 [Trichinella sp. T6]KRY14223.1 hypothetical protein T12_13921 [Trichinella patagoniensis]KRZ54504.1 hypothetical protein T02_16491 [Trichinella nativa]KRZ93852.1 hypothetical protein T08_13568 [Trichinella sp. T8]
MLSGQLNTDSIGRDVGLVVVCSWVLVGCFFEKSGSYRLMLPQSIKKVSLSKKLMKTCATNGALNHGWFGVPYAVFNA